MCEKDSDVSQKDYYKLGRNIRALRKINNESQEKLVEAVGLTKSAISNYENGIRIPEREQLRAIAKHYNIFLSSNF